MDDEADRVGGGRPPGGFGGEVDSETLTGALGDGGGALGDGGGWQQLSTDAPEYVTGPVEAPGEWPRTESEGSTGYGGEQARAWESAGTFLPSGDASAGSAAPGGSTFEQAWAEAWHLAPQGRLDLPELWTHRTRVGRLDPPEPWAPRGKAAQLRQLLDFYFEPFNLQHNRYLLDLIARTMGAPRRAGPWPAETLEEFSFEFEDLMGLGRISSALSKMRIRGFDATCALSAELLTSLKHLRRDPSGRLRLTHPPEVRSFVAAPDARPGSVDLAARWLIAVREDRGPASAGVMSVVSLALTEVMARKALNQQQPSQLKRQLLLHHADVVCLQGFDPESRGRGIAAALREEGYELESASYMAEANCICWDAGRFELVGSLRAGSSLAVDLRPFEDPGVQVRVVCLIAHPPFGSANAGFADLFARPGASGMATASPLLVCGDLSALGGAECACIVEELAGLTSMSQEVLGEEVCAPRFEYSADGNAWPLRAPASGLNRLRHPDVMLFEGLYPLIALSGHSERYVSALGREELVSQFPAFRPTLVAALDWREVLQWQ